VRGQLTLERVRRLDVLSGWVWDTREAAWEENFAALVRFVEREGHARVPNIRVEDSFSVGSWVINQRASYGRGQLSKERANRLEALPRWTWDPYGDDWEKGFEALVRFTEREGHARVPKSYVENDFKLGQWVSGQRTVKNKGQLRKDREERLNAIPGWTWTPLASGQDGNRQASDLPR
jgi:hypothetical protein